MDPVGGSRERELEIQIVDWASLLCLWSLISDLRSKFVDPGGGSRERELEIQIVDWASFGGFGARVLGFGSPRVWNWRSLLC